MDGMERERGRQPEHALLREGSPRPFEAENEVRSIALSDAQRDHSRDKDSRRCEEGDQ